MSEQVIIEPCDDAVGFEPGHGSFRELVDFLDALIPTFIPSAFGQYRLEADEDRKRLEFRLEFVNPDNNGLFIGRKSCNVVTILRWLRNQQLYVHNRYIHIVILKDGEVCNSWWCKNIHKRNR